MLACSRYKPAPASGWTSSAPAPDRQGKCHEMNVAFPRSMPTECTCMSMIVLLKCCHLDHPPSQVNQAADHLISQLPSTFSLPVRHRKRIPSLSHSFCHSGACALVADGVEFVQDQGRGPWHECGARAHMATVRCSSVQPHEQQPPGIEMSGLPMNWQRSLTATSEY